MNRSAIRTTVRRRIQEEDPDYFTDTRLNTIINEAVAEMQMAILETEPEAFVVVDLSSIVADQEAYGFPSGMMYPIQLEIKDPTGGQYSKVEHEAYQYVRDLNLGANPNQGPITGTVYAHRGRDFIISPIPTQNIVQGLRLTHVEVLALDDDTDVPLIPTPLHKYICAKAASLCFSEMGEDPSEMEAEFLLGKSMIPKFYKGSADSPKKLNPQTGNLYNSRGSTMTPGVDTRR